MTIPIQGEMLYLSPFISSITLFLLSLEIHFHGIHGSQKEADEQLAIGKKLLATGQLADAVQHYHLAIDADPNNYMSYFGRATIYLGLGKSRSALPDLTKVLELKPDFSSARLQRGNIFMKQGHLKDAEADFKQLLDYDPSHTEAKQSLASLLPLREDVEEAEEYLENHDFKRAIQILTSCIEKCPWDPSLRELRARAYMMVGESFKAIGDIKSTTKLVTDNTEGFLKISNMYYQLGEAEDSLNEIRECLKLDPDHKACFAHYKHVKKLHKQMTNVKNNLQEQQYDHCIDGVHQYIKTSNNNQAYVFKGAQTLCHCHSEAGHISEALKSCSEVLDRDHDNVEALCDRANAHILNEAYEKAIDDYKRAQEADENSNRAKEGMDRAQKLLKQSKKRDYYKILGVKRNAKKREILKAYRKLAVKWHPDKWEGDDKAAAEKKFIDIAAAKEVLTDPEKREKFDHGEDPLDPEEQANNGNPFHQGFNPFGGGGFQFKFHF